MRTILDDNDLARFEYEVSQAEFDEYQRASLLEECWTILHNNPDINEEKYDS